MSSIPQDEAWQAVVFVEISVVAPDRRMGRILERVTVWKSEPRSTREEATADYKTWCQYQFPGTLKALQYQFIAHTFSTRCGDKA